MHERCSFKCEFTKRPDALPARMAAASPVGTSSQTKDVLGWLDERRQKLSVRVLGRKRETARRRDAVEQANVRGRQEHCAACGKGARQRQIVALVGRRTVPGVAVAHMRRDRRRVH